MILIRYHKYLLMYMYSKLFLRKRKRHIFKDRVSSLGEKKALFASTSHLLRSLVNRSGFSTSLLPTTTR